MNVLPHTFCHVASIFTTIAGAQVSNDLETPVSAIAASKMSTTLKSDIESFFLHCSGNKFGEGAPEAPIVRGRG
jgi:hypothetical protein